MTAISDVDKRRINEMCPAAKLANLGTAVQEAGQGGGGGDLYLVSRTAWVDKVNGDDVSAVVGDGTKPFETIAEALTQLALLPHDENNQIGLRLAPGQAYSNENFPVLPGLQIFAEGAAFFNTLTSMFVATGAESGINVFGGVFLALGQLMTEGDFTPGAGVKFFGSTLICQHVEMFGHDVLGGDTRDVEFHDCKVVHAMGGVPTMYFGEVNAGIPKIIGDFYSCAITMEALDPTVIEMHCWGQMDFHDCKFRFLGIAVSAHYLYSHQKYMNVEIYSNNLQGSFSDVLAIPPAELLLQNVVYLTETVAPFQLGDNIASNLLVINGLTLKGSNGIEFTSAGASAECLIAGIVFADDLSQWNVNLGTNVILASGIIQGIINNSLNFTIGIGVVIKAVPVWIVPPTIYQVT